MKKFASLALASFFSLIILTGCSDAVAPSVTENPTESTPDSVSAFDTMLEGVDYARGSEIDWICNSYTPPILEPQGSPFLLKCSIRKQSDPEPGKETPLTADFDGTMELTVNKCTLYDNVEQSGIDPEEMSPYGEKDKFLLLDMTIRNIDADSKMPRPDQFSIGMLGLTPIEGFKAENRYNKGDFGGYGECYFSNHPVDENESYGTYFLAHGETIEFQLGYAIDSRTYKKYDWALSYQSGGNNLGIVLDHIEQGA